MGFLRFFSVALISGLLLSPILKTIAETTQLPVIVIGQDNSQSIANSFSDQDSADYISELETLKSDLGEKYDVRFLTFGESVGEAEEIEFNDQITDISQFLQYVSENHGDQNLGAVIMASDGLYNRGRNPIYLPNRQKAPVFSIALGDTTQKTDLLIKQVYHNKIVYLGDKFSIQVDIMAKSLQGNSSSFSVEKIENRNRIPIEKRTVKITSDPFFQTEEVILEANSPGVNRYRVRLGGMQEEMNFANNVKDIFVEVIDGRQNILLLCNSPHPDIAALKEIFEKNENYEAEVSQISEFNGQLNNYDLLVLHQLPSQSRAINEILTQANSLKIPRLFIIGNQTDLSRFNQSQSLLTITGAQQSSNEVQGIIDPGFNLFNIGEDLKLSLPGFVPLFAPFGDYQTNPSAHVYLYQKIGKIDTRFPLVLFGESQGIKTGIIAAEGIWKWKLFDFLQNQNHDLITEFASKYVQYLAVTEDKRKFRSAPGKKLYLDNENITFDAQLYNQSYELINTPDVFLILRDEDGKEYNYSFNKTGKIYTLDIGKFPLGEYTYSAYVDYNAQRLTSDGRFSVQPIQLESYETTADHNLLLTLSENNGGSLSYPGNLVEITQAITQNATIKPIVFQNAKMRSIINLKWIFAILVSLLVMEWFMRRYYGGY
jgi:hypothetical protein